MFPPTLESSPTTFDIGYQLGPRINAGGRVGKSSHGAELLTSEDPQRAYMLALDLEKYNKERKSIELLLSEEIFEKIKYFLNDPVLVLSGSGWHEGILGIIAARIKDKYNKPTILISLSENIGKGSARSVAGFDIGSQIIKAVQLNIIKKEGDIKWQVDLFLKKKRLTNLEVF